MGIRAGSAVEHGVGHTKADGRSKEICRSAYGELLKELLEGRKFDEFVEGRCARSYR
jgi:hypothetical protein